MRGEELVRYEIQSLLLTYGRLRETDPLAAFRAWERCVALVWVLEYGENESLTDEMGVGQCTTKHFVQT